jgi:hypothetical protein
MSLRGLNMDRTPRIKTIAAWRLTGAALVMLGLVSGCSDADLGVPQSDARTADAAPQGDAPADSRPEFRSCTGGTMPGDLPTVQWTRLSNRLITLATPWHSAQDILTTPNAQVLLAAKFSYGSISKDLEGERIEVWMDDCAGGYTRLGERVTDSDGRIAFPLAAGNVPAIGEYGLYFRVMGDNSATFAILRVYPRNTRFIVFDIDATLTTSDTELVGQVISEILDNNVVPEAREGAMDITALRHENHAYELLYLTGRPYLLTGITRQWLDDLGFPRGTVRLTDSVASSWPSEGEVGQYKADYLRTVVIGQGFTLPAAYGNATTDIYAYEQAGIDKQRTYILGEHGGELLTVALGEDYLDHIEAVRDEPAAEQPFRRTW